MNQVFEAYQGGSWEKLYISAWTAVWTVSWNAGRPEVGVQPPPVFSSPCCMGKADLQLLPLERARWPPSLPSCNTASAGLCSSSARSGPPGLQPPSRLLPAALPSVPQWDWWGFLKLGLVSHGSRHLLAGQ